jgi:nucleoside-diphosphate-sugar epimerase
MCIEQRAGAQLAGAEVHVCDLLDPPSVERLLAVLRPTHLLHFAWIATPGVYWVSAENFSWVAASLHLVRAFHRNGGIRAVIAGSCAEYDWSRVDVCREDSSATRGQRGKWRNTLCSVQTCTAKHARELRLMPRACPSPGGAFSRRSVRTNTPSVSCRQWCRICSSIRRRPARTDARCAIFCTSPTSATAFAALLDSTVQGPVNIGTPERVSIAAARRAHWKRIGRTDLVRLGARASPANEPAVLVPDVRRLYEEVGWRPAFTLDEALADTIQWWQEALARGAIGEPPGDLAALEWVPRRRRAPQRVWFTRLSKSATYSGLVVLQTVAALDVGAAGGAHARPQLGGGDQALEGTLPFRRVTRVEARAAIDDGLGVRADRGCDAGQRCGHVLQQLECTFAARPLIIGQRHDADVRPGKSGNFGIRHSSAPASIGTSGQSGKLEQITRSRNVGWRAARRARAGRRISR